MKPPSSIQTEPIPVDSAREGGVSRRVWFSVFVGWLCKGLITKFGGIDSYRKMVPAFLGLALGDVAMILFWLVVDGFQGRTGHTLTGG